MPEPIETLGDAYPKEQARIRAVLARYQRDDGPAAEAIAAALEVLLQRADVAAVQQDVVAMILCFEKMQAIR